MWRAGVSTVFIFSCLGLFWGGGRGGRDNFKGYVNGALNVGTKGLKVPGDLAVNVILWL